MGTVWRLRKGDDTQIRDQIRCVTLRRVQELGKIGVRKDLAVKGDGTYENNLDDVYEEEQESVFG